MVQFRGDFDGAMARAVIDTFENLCFMEPVRTTMPVLPAAGEEIVSFSLLVNEPLQGEVRLCLPSSLARMITRTIWSLQDDAVQDKMLRDIVAELLNTLVGRFLADLLSENETFQLGLPEPCMCEDMGDDENVRIWSFSLEDKMFQVIAIGETLLSVEQDTGATSPAPPKEPLAF